MRQIVALLMLAGSALPAFADEPADAVRPFYENIGMEYDEASLELFVDPARSVIEADRRMAEDGDLCLGFLLSVDAQDYDDGRSRAKPGAQPGRRRRTGRSDGPASRISVQIRPSFGAW